MIRQISALQNRSSSGTSAISKRDGKHGYLRHIPRVSRYLERNLAHPGLAPLKRWFDTHLPPARREAQ